LKGFYEIRKRSKYKPKGEVLMTHTEDLIHRLRDTASRGVSSWGDLQQEAADELQALIDMQTTDGILIQNLAEQLSAGRLATELAVAAEREAIAKMFDEALPLIPSSLNDQGGCLSCGFTPKLAAEVIRARGQA